MAATFFLFFSFFVCLTWFNVLMMHERNGLERSQNDNDVFTDGQSCFSFNTMIWCWMVDIYNELCQIFYLNRLNTRVFDILLIGTNIGLYVLKWYSVLKASTLTSYKVERERESRFILDLIPPLSSTTLPSNPRPNRKAQTKSVSSHQQCGCGWPWDRLGTESDSRGWNWGGGRYQPCQTDSATILMQRIVRR